MSAPTQSPLDISQVLTVLRRRSLAVVALVVIIGGATFAYTETRQKQYTATASLSFQQSSNDQIVSGLEASGSSTTPNPASNVEQVSLGGTAAETATKVGHGLTAARVRDMLSIGAIGTTAFINVSATSHEPSLAAKVANAYAQIFVNTQNDADTAYYTRALSLVEKQLAHLRPGQRNSGSALTLETRASSLGILSELRSSGISLAQRASVPTVPSSPKVAEDTLAGVGFGLVLGLALAFGLEGLDRLVRDPRELETIYDLPLLGAIPESAQLSKALRIPEGQDPRVPALESEAFQLIQAHLRYFNVDREIQTLLVTSAVPGDGKTTVSIHLAAAAVRLGAKVLLIEADMRRPTVARKLGLNPEQGLSEVLIGAAAIESAVQTIRVDSTSDAGDDAKERSLDVLIAGATTPPNPAAMIESQAMGAALKYGADNYDFVLIDTPPVTAVSDTIALLSRVDGVVIVGRVGHDSREAARRASETLLGVGAPLLGVVANCVKGSSSAYYYYGGYS